MYKMTLKIEGMACGMCESHVNDSIKNNFDVDEVISSHEDGLTVIRSKEELDTETVKSVVAEEGYTVVSSSVEEE